MKHKDKKKSNEMSIPRLPPLPTIRDLVKMYRLTARKELAQNFLLDERLTNKIIKKSGKLADGEVLEVGPGPGGLTRSIIRKCPERVIVVEKDKRFQPTLEMLAEAFGTIDRKMDIVYDDVMKINMQNLFTKSRKKDWEDLCPNIYIIGNLPFNVSTPLIIKWLKSISERSNAWANGRVRMTLTFQKEVAERLVAPASDKQRSRLSLMAQAWTNPTLEFLIPGSAFLPPPKVDVGVVTFEPLASPRTRHEFNIFEKVVRHIFSFRQKYSVRGVETLFPLEHRRELGSIMYKLSDIDPKTRPMQLTMEEVDRLVTSYKYLIEKHPEIELYEYRASRHLLPMSQTKQLQVLYDS